MNESNFSKVDYMLGSFMEEMQISPEQFEMACLEGRQNTAAGSAFSFHQGLFQQVKLFTLYSFKVVILEGIIIFFGL